MLMKNLFGFLIILFITILSFFIFARKTNEINNINNNSLSDIKPYYNIKYVGDDGLACLTFLNNKEYSLFDCDSEPTEYFFDSEDECTYKLNDDEMIFNCKYNIMNSKTNKIKLTKWNKDEFSFIYNGNNKTFKSEN